MLCICNHIQGHIASFIMSHTLYGVLCISFTFGKVSRHASWIIIVGSIILFRVWQPQSSSACCWKVGALKPTSYLFIIYPSALTPAMCLQWYCSCNSHHDTTCISNYLEDELATFRSSRRERWTSVGMLCFSSKLNTALITMGRVSNSEVANYYN